MTHLAKYIEKTGVRQSSLARDLGISRSHMSELVAGKKSPSPKMIGRIRDVTKGAIPVEAWFSEGGDSTSGAQQ